MDNYQKIQEILEKGGWITWKNKYNLSYIEHDISNPLLEWSGYEIDKISDVEYKTIFKSQILFEALEELNILIDEDIEKR